MLDPAGAFADPDSPRTITGEEHEILADYLTENFGPDSPPRVLRLDVKYPLDEETLSSAMFIEYLTPLHPAADLSQRSVNEPFKHRLHRPMMDNDGNLWGSNSLIGLSRVDPRTAQWSHFPIGYDENNPETDMYGRKKGEPGSIWSYIFPHDLTIDSNGHVFWAEFQGQHLGRLDPKTGKIDRYHMDPEGVVVDEKGVVGNIRGHTPHVAENGDVWFTAIRGNKLGKWDRETEQITLWEIPTPHSFPYGIEIDRRGHGLVRRTVRLRRGEFRSANRGVHGIPGPDQALRNQPPGRRFEWVPSGTRSTLPGGWAGWTRQTGSKRNTTSCPSQGSRHRCPTALWRIPTTGSGSAMAGWGAP